MKKAVLIIIALALIFFGAMHNYLSTLSVGIVFLIFALWLKPKQLLQLCAVILKALFKVEVLEDIKKELYSELKEKYPKIQENELAKIYSAETLNDTTAAASRVVFDHIKENCTNCGSDNVIQIPWNPEFDKLIVNKNLSRDPLAYQCKDCGLKYIKYEYTN
ncbi:MAG: hypothetical protein ACFFBS_10185 [Promethearchaeota archaeon]